MAKITVQNVNQNLGITNTFDIINAIRNSDPFFETYVPLANAENVAEVGNAIMINKIVQNQFINTLINRIGLVIINQLSLQNPLKRFKKGFMPTGYSIQEIFVDLAKGLKYDAEESEDKVFARTIPNVHVLYHELNRQDFYPLTIQDDTIKQAFISWDKFGDFVAQLINSIYNTAEVDEYKYMKLALDNYYAKGLFKVEAIDDPLTSSVSMTDFVKRIRAMVTRMTLPQGSRNYNSLAVHTRSDLEGLHLFVDADLMATMDVDVLARAFNMNSTTFLANVTILDDLAVKSQGVRAMLVDESIFMVYDTKQEFASIQNPRGLYTNYFFHVWQIISTSRFANAVAFVVKDEVKPVTQVIVSPTIIEVKAGRKHQFEAVIRQTDNTKRTVVWAVEPSVSGTTIASGTSIDANGLLTLSENQMGELKVTATVSYTEGEGEEVETINVVGEAIVTVGSAV